jgi:hypothetical protein
MQLHFIREGDGYAEAYFARYLIEDRYVAVMGLFFSFSAANAAVLPARSPHRFHC